MKEEYLKFACVSNFEFDVYNSDWITLFGSSNKKILDSFIYAIKDSKLLIENREINKLNSFEIRKKISYILNEDLHIFVAETVEDEIAFGLESFAMPKNEMKELIESKSREFDLGDFLKRSPDSLGISDKVKLKIISSLVCEPKVLILDNVFSELDYYDKLLVANILKEYVSNNNIVINFAGDIDEALFGNRIIISNEEKIVADGETNAILKQEKLLKKLGIGLPFITDLNNYLINYNIIKTPVNNIEKLVDKIWK